MERYVIRDSYDMTFLVSINGNGISTDNDLKEALIFENIEKAKKILEFLEDDDYVIQEIIFKDIEE